MKLFLFVFASLSVTGYGQTAKFKSPCLSDQRFRCFDFWLGEWDVYDSTGLKRGDSRITLMLDSCVIYEEWTGTSGYKGKSFNLFNTGSGEWQQTWVDNTAATTEFLRGACNTGKVIFYSDAAYISQGKKAKRRLTFTRQGENVRQQGERSDDGAKWTKEYDLLYKRKK